MIPRAALTFEEVCLDVGKTPHKKIVLSHASFRLRIGEIVALVGPSGSGKTTILNLSTGLLRPNSGRICTLGVEVSAAPDVLVSRLRADKVGFVFQTFHLLPKSTAKENVLLPAYFGKTPASALRERSDLLIDRVGLAGWADVPAIELSEGQRQRIAIARALLSGPELVLADEPTGNLDDSSAQRVLSLLIGEVRREKGTLLIATHDRRCLDLVDRTLLLKDGRLVGE